MAMTFCLGRAEPAAVAATESRAGDYVMVCGPVSAGREGLLVIDVVAKRANLYVAKAGTTTGGTSWEMTSTRNLAADFSGGARAGARTP